MNSKKSSEETGTARILVIGISTFGAKLIDKLKKYQDSIQEDFGCTFLTITNEHDIESLPKTLCEKSDLILIVAEEGQFSARGVSKVVDAFNRKDQLIIGFFNGFQQYNLGAKLTNRVNLTGDFEEAYNALRLLPDIISLPPTMGIDFETARIDSEDLRAVASTPKFFNVATEEVRNMMYSFDVDLSHSESIIFCVYGDDKLDMDTIDSASLQICNSADGEAYVIYSVNPREPSYTKPRVVILY